MALDFSLFTGTFANAWLGLLDSPSTDGHHVLFCELRRALDTRLHASALTSELRVAILDLYFSEYLLISSLTVGILRSLRMSSFLTYHGTFTIVLRILAYIVSILFIWLIPYVQIGFMIVLYIFNLFSVLNLDFRLVSQCICLLVFCIFLLLI